MTGNVDYGRKGKTMTDLELFTKITGFEPRNEEERTWARIDMAGWSRDVKCRRKPADMCDAFRPYASSQEEALDMAEAVWKALGSEQKD